jgi:glycosyltransferase involved in cell wall biosynthesis
VAERARASRCVGLDALLLSLSQTYRGAGINGYIYQLLQRLPAVAQPPTPGAATLEYRAFLYDPGFTAPAGLAVQRSPWDTRSPWRRILWEQSQLAALSGRLDLLHGLAFAAPLAARCPTIITIHDLSFLRFPEAFRPVNRAYLTLATRASVRRAACVIAVSESTRQDVISFLAVPPEKVVVVHNGVTDEFCEAPAGQAREHARRAGLPESYILFLGTLEPRKNLVRLLEAYARLRQMRDPRQGDAPPLMIAGGKGWYYQAVMERVEALGLANHVIFPGFIPSEELPWLYRAASLFVYPSLFEGFGLPVLEAMACGAPVITSTVSSLPEVAGDAALLVDPEDAEGLALAMQRVLDEPGLAEGLREAGRARAAGFSWDRTAAATAEQHRRVLAMSGGTP